MHEADQARGRSLLHHRAGAWPNSGLRRPIPDGVRFLDALRCDPRQDRRRELTREDLRAYLRQLDRQLAPTTVQLEMIRLRRVLSFLHDEGLLLENPIAGLRRKRVLSPL